MEIGKHSRKLVELRKAIRSGTLTSHGLLAVEGPNLLTEADKSGLEIIDVFALPEAMLPMVLPKALYQVPPALFKTIQDTEHSQGVIATVRPRTFALQDVLEASPELVIVLGRLQDPGNVGTILRIGESFGATGCIALPGTVSFYNSKVLRASAGSVFRLPHVAGIDSDEIFRALRLHNISIVGTSPTAGTTIDKWDWRKPAAIVVGNEGGGLSSEELGHCDTVLRIPHRTTVESLNSATAAAVVLYEAFRQRS
jgi:RNA methyltransferase, TrmH family